MSLQGLPIHLTKCLHGLNSLLRLKKQFTSDASHELRTPISVIKGACEYALKYDETPEEREETISMINRQAAKMSVLFHSF